MVINGPAPVRLAVAAVNARGDTLSARWLTFRASNDGVITLEKRGVVRCHRQGDASVLVSQRGRFRRLSVHCRPIYIFGLPYPTPLVLGQQPVPLQIEAFDSSHQRITELAGIVEGLDPDVVTYSGGLLHPVGFGSTNYTIDFSGVTHTYGIAVIRRLVQEPLALVAGEIRTWRLHTGRSEISLVADSMLPTASRPVLQTYRANCAQKRRRAGEQHWYCLSTGEGRLIVSNANPVGSRRIVRGELQLFELPR